MPFVTLTLVGLAVLAPIASTPTTSPAAGAITVEIVLDPERQAELAANYVAFDALVTDAATGARVEEEYALRATVRSGDVVDDTVFHLAYPFREDPSAEPGRYPGVVIVPRGGEWTIAVNVFDRFAAETEAIPVTLARTETTVFVDAPSLASAGDSTPATETSGAKATELALRIAHSIIGLVWFVLAGVLALAGAPRPLLRSGEAGSLIERHLGGLIVALVWVTGLVWLTGALSLRVATAFPPPLSPDQAERLFRVPYARAYTVTLWVKVAMAAAMTVIAVPMIRRARRVVTRAAPATRTTIPLAVAVGGAVILVCVSVLTYVHTVSERTSG